MSPADLRKVYAEAYERCMAENRGDALAHTVALHAVKKACERAALERAADICHAESARHMTSANEELIRGDLEEGLALANASGAAAGCERAIRRELEAPHG